LPEIVQAYRFDPVFIATVAVTALLATLLVLSAYIKLTRREPFVQGYLRVGVPEHRLNALAYLLLLGATGLAAGLWWAPAGIAAATGLTCYFLAAVAAHLRADDARSLPTPLTYLALAVAALILRLATL
jgi:DoxX-like family